jgi:hypothetical protein
MADMHVSVELFDTIIWRADVCTCIGEGRGYVCTCIGEGERCMYMHRGGDMYVHA